ncbi:E3 ubiquitin-protein ligase RNF4 [Hyperolius riggenbachi]|uniref:E3 ubiquitin-protein ligase RNF4 n=1 Tax=Hyperolius riggenbachi TaxID=752182 RepID=UPI0035A2D9A0
MLENSENSCFVAQRKRKSSQSSKTRSSQKRRRGSTSTSSMSASAELIELEESGEEVVDLTCESYEPTVVDLTDLSHNDSVVIVEERPGHRRDRGQTSTQAASCILSSDDEDSRDDLYGFRRAVNLTSSEYNRSRSSAGDITCPICMDGYSEITQSGRLIVSTKCGHVFCSQCLRDALKNATSCPTCRKKLTHKQYHPIYI